MRTERHRIEEMRREKAKLCGTQSLEILDSLQKVNNTAIPVQTWTGPEDSRRLRLPDFKKAHEDGKVISPMHRLPLPLRKYP
jgi:hypothetical protein